MTYHNPFPYSDDNKRYHTWNYYLKHTFHHKVFKAALNANFSCPNRDGVCGWGGCTFCSALGSGDMAGNMQDDLLTQFHNSCTMMKQKWPNGKAIAYFQAYTNTYRPLQELPAYFEPFVKRNDVTALAIATRADCLEDNKIAYLDELAKQKEIWIEIGLQSIHDQTAKLVNRGHDLHTFLDCIERLQHTRLKICVHLMNSLPYETEDMMIETAKAVGKLPIHAVKIHMLHIMKHTQMAEQYSQNPFPMLSKEAYIDIVVKQLEVLPASIIIQRLTGDAPKDSLITPAWTLKKVCVLNDIDKEMVKRDTWQGKYAS